MTGTTPTHGIQLQNNDRIRTATGSTVELYGGSAPFVWTLDVYLEKESLGSETRWFLSLHLTAQGTQQQVVRSATVEVVPGVVTPVPFPREEETSPVVEQGDYGMAGCAATYQSSTTVVPKSIGVMVVVPPDNHPFVHIVDTTVDVAWLIGVRHIVLTDPPLRNVLSRAVAEAV